MRKGVPSLVVLAFAASCTIGPERSYAIAPSFESDAMARAFAAPEPVATSRATAPKIADGVGKSYTIAKAGVFMPDGDLDGLDDGFSAELIFGRALLPFLALEGSIGYLDADGGSGPSQFELWAIPLFVNARASVPILIFEPYAGIGIGGIYADYSAGPFSNTDFVAAWNGFLGVEVGLGRLAVGAEYKYIQSEDTKDDFAIEGATASLFVSLPF